MTKVEVQRLKFGEATRHLTEVKYNFSSPVAVTNDGLKH